jgi:hypothetical protein
MYTWESTTGYHQFSEDDEILSRSDFKDLPKKADELLIQRTNS